MESEGQAASRKCFIKQDRYANRHFPNWLGHILDCRYGRKNEKGRGIQFDVLFVLPGKMEDIHCPLLPKDPQCNSSLQWSHGECAPGVTWSDGSHQFTMAKTENKRTQEKNNIALSSFDLSRHTNTMCYCASNTELNTEVFFLVEDRGGDKWIPLSACHSWTKQDLLQYSNT